MLVTLMDCQVISDLVDYCSQQRLCLRSERSSVAIYRKSYKKKSKKSSSNRMILKLTSIWVLLKSFDHFPVVKWSLLWIWNEQRQRTQWPVREVTSFNGSYPVTIRMPKITSNYELYFLLLKWRSYFRKNQGLSAEHWGTFWHTAGPVAPLSVLLWTAVKLQESFSNSRDS